MIFVTVGTHPQSFNRLLKAIDELIKKDLIKEEVVMQIGYSTYEPKNARWFRFTNYEEIQRLNMNARLIISHGGAGCILTALSYSKPLIVIPRLKKVKEHTDDHQVQLAKKLQQEGKIIFVDDVKNIFNAIRNVSHIKNKRIIKKNFLSKIISRYISSLS